MSKAHTAQYLAKYAESEAQAVTAALAPLRCTPWDEVLTVPLVAEDLLLPQFVAGFIPTTTSRRILLVLLVNARENAAPEVLASNERSIAFLKARFNMTRLTSPVVLWFGDTPAYSVLVIDRGTDEAPRLPNDQGVGLARKIVGDVAVSLQEQGRIKSPWVHCSDADVLLPSDYFTIAAAHHETPNVAGLIMPFAHIMASPSPSWKALVQYEVWLRYYVLGLIAAGSPYGYPAIGSMITFHRTPYAMSRGFPKRLAGEDFYLLNKLAKLGSILCPMSPVVRIMDRPSDRVPFGTGVGTQKILDLTAEGAPYTIYDPRIFVLLAAYLDTVIKHFATANHSARQHDFLTLTQAFDFHAELWRFTEELGTTAAMQAAKQRGRTVADGLREFHYWFDAFKTLRFVHEVRDRFLPNLPFAAAIARAPFLAAHSMLLSDEDLALTHLRSLTMRGTHFPSREMS